MKHTGTVWVVDDDPSILIVLKQIFEDDLGLACVTFDDGEKCLAQIDHELPDLVFLDLAMPGVDGITVLQELQARDRALPVVMITAFGGLDSAVKAVHEGAYDFLTKPLDLKRLRILAQRALETRMLRRLDTSSEALGRVDEGPRIVGRHPSMVEIFKLIGAVSASEQKNTVLITGETGVGKDLVARAIHESGPASAQPFVTVQCAGVPETLIDNELFGHEKGAFTDAKSRYIGRIETAALGTVFLDEIGELPPLMQVKLLRVLETREFERLGGQQSLRAQCRFIAATNRDLTHAIDEGAFREDLFYRLRVVTIHVPPLRERREDIPMLVNHFLGRIGRELKRFLSLDPEAQQLLLQGEYPGNVRELLHVLEQAATLCRGRVILPEHLQISLGDQISRRSDLSLPRPAHRDTPSTLPIASHRLTDARQEFERQFIEQTLRVTGGNVTAAAERAGVRRQHFQRLMQRYDILSESFRSK